MEQKESTAGMLNLMIQPACTVRNGVVELVNEAAKQYQLQPGTVIFDLLLTGHVEYRNFQGGSLYLTLSIGEIPCGASVHRMEEFDLFILEQEDDQAELQAMALAAQELRVPLSNVMTVADQLFPVAQQDASPAVQEQIARINRGLFQMVRMISNMSDSYRYSRQIESKMSIENITNFIGEVFERAAQLLHSGQTQLTFINLNRSVFGLIDKEKLERAILNMISNAAKFSKKESTIEAKLIMRGDMLYLSVQGSGTPAQLGIPENIHARFRRQPRVEDSHFGIGLGMVLIRTAASIHGGTVLLDQPDDQTTRMTMSLVIRQNIDSTVRTNPLYVDYAGERDHALIELSDVLPFSTYESNNVN